MASGVVAYGKDGKVVGSLQDLSSSYSYVATQKKSIDDLGSSIVVNSFWPDNVHGIIKQGTKKLLLKTEIQMSDFGNATAADVAKGKTFTSAAGLKVVGTAAGSSAADVTFDLYNNGFANLVAVYMSKTDGVMDTTIPNSDHRSITTSEGSMVVLINQDFNGDSIDLVPDNGVHIAQGWRMENVTMFVAGAETNGMNIDVNIA